MTPSAPSLAKWQAIASPIPAPALVIIATLPSNRLSVSQNHLFSPY
ncbi:hypothetical protein [Aliterella atlantica]|nr:hypothetical protein [Aliterella atlantica]